MACGTVSSKSFTTAAYVCTFLEKEPFNFMPNTQTLSVYQVGSFISFQTMLLPALFHSDRFSVLKCTRAC